VDEEVEIEVKEGREGLISRLRRGVLKTLKSWYMRYNGIRHCGFPSIESYRKVIAQVKKQAKYYQENMPVVRYEGRVKVHGVNMSVAMLGEYKLNPKMWVQSRNQILTMFDHPALCFGFRPFFKKSRRFFEEMFNLVHGEYMGHLPYGNNTITVIYGEWAGKDVLGGSAMAQVEQAFLVFGVAFYLAECTDDESLRKSQVWLDNDTVRSIVFTVRHLFGSKAPRIYSIDAFKKWSVDIDFGRPEEIQTRLVEITQEVENECPVANTFGVAGIGEGVVWSPNTGDVPRWLRSCERELVFKVKGAAHSPTHVKVMAAPNPEKLASVKDFVTATVTEVRLQQGLEYMKSSGILVIKANTSAFVKWVCGDIIKEEKDVIEASGLDLKEALRFASREAMIWYKERVK
jgi:hypothetical protein